jgi:DNA-binding response OmpR family regulator
MDPIRALIVDDEGQFVEAVVERLRLRGFDADGVTDGHEAVEMLSHRPPYDVVLLDVKMPGLGGLDVIRQIKEKWPHLQVVLLTGHGSTQDAEEGMQLGAFKYVMKPVNIEELTSILRAASEHDQDTAP